MKTLKLTLITASALKSIDYFSDSGEIICRVDASDQDWDETLFQTEWDKKWQHAIWYKSEIWLKIER